MTRVSERHVYQFGALGGATEDEYLRGGPRVAAYLRRSGVPLSSWRPPRPDGRAPEAEWGLDDALVPDVLQHADEQDLDVVRVAFDEPDDLSPLVADLEVWRRTRAGLPPQGLLVESFILVAPERAPRLGLVPFWMLFNTERSLFRLEQFLDARPAFPSVWLTLFQHGVDSIGQVSIDRWRRALDRGKGPGRLVGVDGAAHPRDLAVYLRFDRELELLETGRRAGRREGRTEQRLPPLSLDELLLFLDEAPSYPGVEITVTPARLTRAPRRDRGSSPPPRRTAP